MGVPRPKALTDDEPNVGEEWHLDALSATCATST